MEFSIISPCCEEGSRNSDFYISSEYDTKSDEIENEFREM